jgi:hypothetical protein
MTLEPECDEAAPLVPHAVLPTPFEAPRYRLAMRCSDRSRLARQHGRLQATMLLRTIGCRRASALDHWSAPPVAHADVSLRANRFGSRIRESHTQGVL